MIDSLQALSSKESVLTIDGERYILSGFHLNAQAAIQEHLGYQLMSVVDATVDENGEMRQVVGFEKLIQDISTDPAHLRYVVWQLLRKNHRSMTEDDVGYLITIDNYLDVMKEVVVLITSAMPLDNEKKKEMIEQVRSIKITG